MEKLKTLTGFIILCTVFALVGCKEQYEKTIENYMKEHLDDPKSYEVISFNYVNGMTAKDVFAKGYENSRTNSTFERIGDVMVENITRPSPKEVDSATEKFMEKFIEGGGDPERIYFHEITHDFRAKNLYGGTAKQHMVYLLSTDMKKVCAVGNDFGEVSSPINQQYSAFVRAYLESNK